MKYEGKHINLPLKAITAIFKCIRENKQAKVRVDAKQLEAVLLLADKLGIDYGYRCKEPSTTKLYFNLSPRGSISYLGFDGDTQAAEDLFLECRHVEINLTEEYNLPQSVIKKLIYYVVNKEQFKVRGSTDELLEAKSVLNDLGVEWAGPTPEEKFIQAATFLFVRKGRSGNLQLTYSRLDSIYNACNLPGINLHPETVIPLSRKGLKRWVKQGRSFRLEVSGDAESIWIQETLFKLGMDWAHHCSKEVSLSCSCLFFHGKDCDGVTNCLSHFDAIEGDGDVRKDFPIVKLNWKDSGNTQKSKEGTMLEDKWLETDQEIYGALIAGKTLILARTGGLIYKIVNGQICRNFASTNSVWEPVDKPMSQVQPLKEYKEPQWYDNLTNGTQVLCWVGDAEVELENKLYLGLVNKFKSGTPSAFQTVSGVRWRYATPVTKEEILPNILK